MKKSLANLMLFFIPYGFKGSKTINQIEIQPAIFEGRARLPRKVLLKGPYCSGAPENFLASRDQIQKIASISANFSPIFKIFFLLKGYEKGFQKQAQTVVLMVSVLQAPLGDFLA